MLYEDLTQLLEPLPSLQLTEKGRHLFSEIRDTTTEIRKIKDLKERGMIKEDTTKTLDETVAASNEATESFRQTVEDMKEAVAPQTAEAIKKARERVKTKKTSK